MKWQAEITAAVPGSGFFSCSPAAADAATTTASSAATADAATIAVCGSSCFCSAAAATAASAATMADAAANQPSGKAGSMEPAFPSPCLLQKSRPLSLFPLLCPQASFLALFVSCTPHQARKSSYHL